MTVARDSFLESATFTTTTPHTFTGPAPVGTVRSVTVLIGSAGEATDLITGAVTCDGVAMGRPTNGFAADSATEAGTVYAYHLGTETIAAAPTISISHNGSTRVKWAICYLDTAAADTEILVSGKLEDNQANPQLPLDVGAASALRKCILYSGLPNTGDAVALAGMEAVSVNTSHDFGNAVVWTGEQTTASTGSFTIGFTAADDDVAFLAIAIQEVSGAATVDPYPYVGGGYYPTQG